MHPFYHISPLYHVEDSTRLNGAASKTGDHRDPFERDRARIIHSFAFRRLQSKTQIFAPGESSFLRTRLTHTLEVSNLGRALAAVINQMIWPGYPLGTVSARYEGLGGPVDTSLIEAACLAHDLGHPPFGHRGEEALNQCVWTRWPGLDNGFEGNGQTLRLLTNENLEVHGERHGLNLTRATLQAVIKYPGTYANLVNTARFPDPGKCPPFKPWAPPKCIHNEEAPLLDWLFAPFPAEDRARVLQFEHRAGKHARTLHKTLEASIVELADDIAYGTHDVEDAFFSRLITPEAIIGYMPRDNFEDPAIFDLFADLLLRMGSGAGGGRRDLVYEKKEAGSELISRLITAAFLVESDVFIHPRLRWNVALPGDFRIVLDALKNAVYEIVINGPSVQSLEYRGGIIIQNIFAAYCDSPELLGGKHGYLLREAASEPQRLRVLSDYIAGMTDTFAERTYNRLFQPGSGSVFDRA